MLIKTIETIPEVQRSAWVLEKEGKINRAVEELLELTTWVQRCAFLISL